MVEVASIEGYQSLYLPPGHAEQTAALRLQAGLVPDRPVICLHTQSPHWPAKQWGLASFAELGRRLQETWRAQLVLVGSEPVSWPKEGPPVYDFTGRLNLLATASLLQSADLHIGLDSGPAHLAAGVGTPVVVIYGGTAPETCRPLGPQVEVVQLKEPCNPCFINHMSQCVLPVPCIARLSVEQVFAATTPFLQRFNSP
jgi:ADP-heptose:LPS heptosyltransferase